MQHKAIGLRPVAQSLRTGEFEDTVLCTPFVLAASKLNHCRRFNVRSPAVLLRLAGGEASRVTSVPKSTEFVGFEYGQQSRDAMFPSKFDWRSFGGVDYLFPVVDQV